jgi:hypothetical protein
MSYCVYLISFDYETASFTSGPQTISRAGAPSIRPEPAAGWFPPMSPVRLSEPNITGYTSILKVQALNSTTYEMGCRLEAEASFCSDSLLISKYTHATEPVCRQTFGSSRFTPVRGLICGVGFDRVFFIQAKAVASKK